MPNAAKPKLIRPTPEEDAAINAGIAADPDTYEMTDEEFAEAARRKRGRPAGSVAATRKEPVTIRLDEDLVQTLRASGEGWQTRVNEVLRNAYLGDASPTARAADRAGKK